MLLFSSSVHAQQSSASTATAASTSASAATSTDARKNVAAQIEAITVVATGTRGKALSRLNSAAPVSLISHDDLAKAGGASVSLRDALAELTPSFQVNTATNSAGSTIVRPAELRGLSLAHVLVLVDGKRRHNSSIANMSPSSQAAGANTVDLDLIPVGEVDHVEVLTDGAAAQYGSDAVAGVINIILTKRKSGIELGTMAGQRYPWQGTQDGQTFNQTLSTGFSLGRKGFLNVTLDGKVQNWTVRNGPSTQTFFAPLPDGQPNPMEHEVDRKISRAGLPQTQQLLTMYNGAYQVTKGVEYYTNGSYTWRRSIVGQTYRVPYSIQYLPQIYGDSIIQPKMMMNEQDFQFTNGIRGKDLFGWNWDLSVTTGRDQGHQHQIDTLNPSLGPSSPTSFATYNVSFAQTVTNFDMSRGFRVGLPRPLNVAWGLEHRYETYYTHPQDPRSSESGGYVFTSGPFAGQHAAVGAQGSTIMTPDDAANIHRTNYAAYVDVSYDITKAFLADVAGRYEYYDGGVGSVESGKISLRYKVTDRFTLRGTVSNGFRAPSLSQMGFSTSATGFNTALGANTLTTTVLVPPTSAVARALGAKPLKPEHSTNFSAGFMWLPENNLELSADIYRISLRNRIAQTNYLTGSGVSAILEANGLSPNQSISYYANAIDTDTSGVDVSASWLRRFGDYGQLRLNMGFNWNITQITKVANNPSQLAALNLTLFDRVARGYITDYTPKTKLILGLDWKWRKLDILWRVTRYGQYDLIYSANNPSTDQHYAPKWITDLDISYQVLSYWKLNVGANNLFNVYPSRSTVVDASGSSYYATNSPFGQYGGFYYIKSALSF